MSKQQLIEIILSLDNFVDSETIESLDIANVGKFEKTKKTKPKRKATKREDDGLVQSELFEEPEPIKKPEVKVVQKTKNGYGNAEAVSNFKKIKFSKKELEEINKDVDKIKIKPRDLENAERASPMVEMQCINEECGKIETVNSNYYDPESFKCNSCCKKEV